GPHIARFVRSARGHFSIVPQQEAVFGKLSQNRSSAAFCATICLIRSAANRACGPHFFSGIGSEPPFVVQKQARRRFAGCSACSHIARRRSPLRTSRTLCPRSFLNSRVFSIFKHPERKSARKSFLNLAAMVSVLSSCFGA